MNFGDFSIYMSHEFHKSYFVLEESKNISNNLKKIFKKISNNLKKSQKKILKNLKESQKILNNLKKSLKNINKFQLKEKFKIQTTNHLIN